MNILFTADRGYIEHLEDCICSFLRFPAKDGYDIYFFHSDFRAEDMELMEKKVGEGARLHFINVDPEMFSGFPENIRYPRLIYYRIFAASLLPVELDRVLYLDGDTIVINPLDELYSMNFGDNCILACTHIRKFLNKINQYRLGMEEECSYINSGVMLMNLKMLREIQKFEDVVKYVEKRKNYLTLPDQDIITALYGEKIGILDTMLYNLSDRMLAFYNSNPKHEKLDLEWIRKNTVILHYYGRQKPWKENYRGILDVFYRELKDQNF